MAQTAAKRASRSAVVALGEAANLEQPVRPPPHSCHHGATNLSVRTIKSSVSDEEVVHAPTPTNSTTSRWPSGPRSRA